MFHFYLFTYIITTTWLRPEVEYVTSAKHGIEEHSFYGTLRGKIHKFCRQDSGQNLLLVLVL